ncbi:MAG: DNA-3-methyladenine glycosylase [Candidatus Eremiobacteraeota bacterium]|nr:DNA-3-methyladenine glycosylase [Candidatus Eremiobacteraeota bacterium]
MSTDTSERALAELLSAPTVDVARGLVGATLLRTLPPGEPGAGQILSGRIVETEAYLPLVDPACHGYRGPTRRTAVLFGRPGFAYIYLIYGMHFCLNVKTEPAGVGAAVLLRAVEPIEGIEEMRRRRAPGLPDAAIASGPGNLCRALSIDLRENGADLRSGGIRIQPASGKLEIRSSGRIGINVAARWPLRFYDPNSPSVSPFKRGVAAC